MNLILNLKSCFTKIDQDINSKTKHIEKSYENLVSHIENIFSIQLRYHENGLNEYRDLLLNKSIAYRNKQLFDFDLWFETTFIQHNYLKCIGLIMKKKPFIKASFIKFNQSQIILNNLILITYRFEDVFNLDKIIKYFDIIIKAKRFKLPLGKNKKISILNKTEKFLAIPNDKILIKIKENNANKILMVVNTKGEVLAKKKIDIVYNEIFDLSDCHIIRLYTLIYNYEFVSFVQIFDFKLNLTSSFKLENYYFNFKINKKTLVIEGVDGFIYQDLNVLLANQDRTCWSSAPKEYIFDSLYNVFDNKIYIYKYSKFIFGYDTMNKSMLQNKIEISFEKRNQVDQILKFGNESKIYYYKEIEKLIQVYDSNLNLLSSILLNTNFGSFKFLKFTRFEIIVLNKSVQENIIEYFQI